MAYPISYDDYPDDRDLDVNVHGSQGGLENLPDTEAYHGADTDHGDAKTWNPDYSSY